MPHERILAIVQAGGAGSRMDVLTRERAKPALPFAGVYQLIDFSLSNLAHSGITDVWLSVQFQGSTPRGAGLQRPALGPRPQPRRAAAADAAGGHRVHRRGGLRHGQRRRALPAPRPDPRRGPGVRRGDERRPRLPVRLPRCHRHPRELGRRLHRRHHRGAIGEAGDHASCEVGDDRRVTGFEYKPDAAADGDGGHRDLRLRPGDPGRDAGAAAPRARGRTPPRATAAWPTSATICSPGSSSGTTWWPTRWRATGATSASRTSTSPPTATSCSTTSGSSATRTGRS